MEFTRVTSGFSRRFHPILKTWREHKGVDYGDLMSVMDALRAAGYLKVGLVGLETAAKK